MLKVALDHSPMWWEGLTPEHHCSIDAIAVGILTLVVGHLSGDYRPRLRSRDLRRTPLPIRKPKALAHIVATFPPVVTGKGMTSEPVGSVGVDPDSHAAVVPRMGRTRGQNLIAIDLSA
jgi:hypothetical protein